MNKTTHIAYDYGILDFLGKDKTKLTLCNVRVSMRRIDNDNATCEHCQHEKSEAERIRKLIQDKNNIFHPFNADNIGR